MEKNQTSASKRNARQLYTGGLVFFLVRWISMIIKGKVMKGMGIGAKLGYPTANIECEGCESGVYVAQVVVDGVSYKSVAVVGVRENLVEVLLLNFNGNLYNKEIQVEIFDKVSEIETFDNQEALIKKIESDIRKVLCLQE